MDGHGSHPMYLLDGKLTANDVLTKNYVFADPSYRTILIGYLGRGGNGFYAMNITEAGTEPEFLWAIENPYYGTVSDDVKTWGATGGIDYDYSRLGLTIVPGVLLTPKVKVTGTLAQMSVVALPGGLGHKLGKGGDTQGKILYFFDPNDGEIFHDIELEGMGVTPVTYQEGESLSIAGGGKLKYTDSLYTADSEGNVLFFNLSSADANLTAVGKEQIFKLTTTDILSSPVVIPFAMASARVGIGGVGNDWLFGGTANIAGPGSAISEDMVLSNREQFIFGLNSVKLKSVSGASMSDLAELPYITDTIIKPLYTPTPPHPTTTDNGWYIKLRPYKKDGLIETEPEYASASAFLFNGYLYVATFTPYGGERPCKGADIGAGKIYIFKLVDGRPTETMFAVVMENIKIVGFSGVGRNLAISTQELAEGAIAGAKTALENAGMTDVKLLGEGIIEMIAPAVPAPLPDIPRGVPYIQYWREKFN